MTKYIEIIKCDKCGRKHIEGPDSAFLYPSKCRAWPPGDGSDLSDNAMSMIEDNGTEDGGRVLCILPIDTPKEVVHNIAKDLGILNLTDSAFWN